MTNLRELMDRARHLEELRSGREFDVLIIGGGATGLGCAVDAAYRGLSVALVEQHDFAKGTSSRSTKLIHGGVRYLRQGNIGLVREALHERATLLRNAPHIVHRRRFVVPAYRVGERPFVRFGLWLYDQLAAAQASDGDPGFAPSRSLSASEVGSEAPGLRREGLRGGVVYEDGQFDDARMCVALLQTAVVHGALATNYVRVDQLLQVSTPEGQRVAGAVVTDTRPYSRGASWEIRARVVLNATGAFGRRFLESQEPTGRPRPYLTLSRGVHLVLRPEAVNLATSAVMFPHTDDGRVLFMIPWHGRVLLGTTDVPIDEASLEPEVTEEEARYLVEHANRYLREPIGLDDVASQFAGIRPLVEPAGSGNAGGKRARLHTRSISREHVIDVSSEGLVSILGGKWTTYRKMAQQTINAVCEQGRLTVRPDRDTEALPLWDTPVNSSTSTSSPLHPDLPYAMADVGQALEQEMAMTTEDILARRTRALFLDVNAALAGLESVLDRVAAHHGMTPEERKREEETFRAIARKYLP